jgi:hypothetical protein
MLETFIVHVLCSAGSDSSWQYRPILCDAVVLLQDKSIIHTTAALNPCHLPDNVLRLLTHQPMQQIVLTACSVMMENDDNDDGDETSFLLPLIPTPDEFWLDDGPDMVEWDVRFDFSVAERMLADTRIIDLLQQPLPLFVDKGDKEEEEIMERNEAEDEALQDANVTDVESIRSCEAILRAVNPSSHQKPVIKPHLATPMSFVSANNYDGKNKVPQPNPIQHEMSPLELYLQQEVAKNDRLFGFLVVVTIILLTIFGCVGYRILPTTTNHNHHHRQSKADELKKQWLANQQVRRQNRLTVNKPFLLKPTTADRKVKLVPLQVASTNRPECVSPPRPVKSPPRLVTPKSPPRVVESTSVTKKNPKAKSFEDELRAKSGVTGNKNASLTAAVSWEDLM